MAKAHAYSAFLFCHFLFSQEVKGDSLGTQTLREIQWRAVLEAVSQVKHTHTSGCLNPTNEPGLLHVFRKGNFCGNAVNHFCNVDLLPRTLSMTCAQCVLPKMPTRFCFSVSFHPSHSYESLCKGKSTPLFICNFL